MLPRLARHELDAETAPERVVIAFEKAPPGEPE